MSYAKNPTQTVASETESKNSFSTLPISTLAQSVTGIVFDEEEEEEGEGDKVLVGVTDGNF